MVMEYDKGQVEQLQVTYHPKGAAVAGQICDVIEHLLV